MNTSVVSDRELAHELVDAVARVSASGNTDDEATVKMILAESAIAERIGLSADETEQGLTLMAVCSIEAFVQTQLDCRWRYAL